MSKIKIEKKTVEQLLAEVDYSWKGYTPSENSLMFAAFIAEVNGGAEENKTPIMHLAMMDSVFNDFPRNALLCHRGSAKRQPLYSKILTPYGWISMGEIEAGDELFDRNGDVQTVESKTRKIRSMTYRIHLSDKSTYDIDEDHLNIVYSNKKESVLTTSELMKIKDKCYIPNCSPIKFTRSEEEVNIERGLCIKDKNIVKQSIPVKMKLLKNIFLSSNAAIVCTKSSTTIKIKRLGSYHDIRNMILSLGGSWSAKKTLVCYSNVKIVLPFNLLTDTGYEKKKNLYRRIIKIEPLGITAGHCISVSGTTNSYITDNYAVTHNTALFAEYLTLWKASFNNIPGFGRTNLSLYVADSIENGVKNLRRNVEFRFRESDYLNWLIPKKKILVFTQERKSATLDDYEEAVNGGYKFTDIRLEFENRDGGRHVTKGYGVNTGIKGPLALNELVYMDNTTKTIKNVKLGDMIFASNGSLTKVIGKSGLFYDDMYELVFADGRTLKVNSSHENPLLKYTEKRVGSTKVREYKKIKITTEELYSKKLKHGTLSIYQTEIPLPIKTTEKDFVLDPYLVGIALGDGWMPYSRGLYIGGLIDDIDYYATKIKHKTTLTSDPKNDKIKRLSIHGITSHLKEIGIAGTTGLDKFIPKEYLFGSIEQRRELLAGLLDTDGSCSRDGRISFSNISKQLIDDVMELARSLGYYVSSSERKPIRNKKLLYVLYIRGSENPFSLPRKAKLWKRPVRFKNRIPLIAVRKIKPELSQCIRVEDESHQFITTGFIDTCNTKELGVRPYDCTFDDLLQGDDAARSDVVVQTVKNTIYKDVAKALHPQHRKMIYLGTPYNQSDPLYQAVESGVWTRSVYPICEFFDRDTTIDTFKGSWEDRFSFDYAKDEYDTAISVGQPAAFFQELMLQITSDEDKLLKFNEISWYPSIEQVTYNIQNYNIYATTDFASTERDSADYSCMNIWAVDTNSKIYWIDGFMWKKTMDKNIDGLFDMHKKHNYMSVGIEVTGQQNSYISWLMREMRTRKQTIGIARDPRSNEAGIRPITNKIARFNMVLPALKRGDILFPRDLYDNKDERIIEIVEELTQATKQGFNSRYKDQVDTISMLAFMPISPGSITTDDKKRKENNGSKDMFDLFDIEEPPIDGMSSYIP